MTTNPLYNALLAVAYIAGVVSLLFLGPTFLADQDDNIFMPMLMLSLLVLSVAVMAFLFFYKPVTLLLDGERDKAVKLFLHTIGIFAVATILIFLASATISF